MTQPYFIPDPSIEDADLLGYGDLLFDNGTTKYLNGDAELAAGLPRQNIDQPASAPAEITPQPIEGTDFSVDPATGNIMSSNANDVSQYLNQTQRQPPPPPGEHAPTGMSRESDLQDQLDQTSGMGAMPPQPIPGSNMQVDPATGNISPAGAGAAQPAVAAAPEYGYGAGGLLPAQREGAIPQELAQQQASQRETLNTNEMLSLSTARQNEADIYRQAALKRQGELDAERAAQQKQLEEQQAKLQRWQQEQRDTAAMDIKTDLVSAEGSIGAVFSILGAAVLGAVGSEAGLRMIDNSIDTNVKKQMSMRESKLRVLADQVGSTEQAIAAGKAMLYKIAADRVETTQQLTKADAFEAQTPEILSSLRQKQQLYEQEQQRISLGKTIEKAPVAAQPKPIDVEKYGKLAAEQAQQEKNIDRAANAIGLAGWDPKTGKFANREEVIKKGLPGVGKFDTFINDLGKLPVVGSIPRAADALVTSNEGMKVRAALEALVAAEAKQQNPGRAPTDADRDAARISLGLNTEEGVINAIERLKGFQEQTRAQNTAAFGAAAGAYENRIDAMGARPPQANGPVDMGRPLEPGRAREMLQQERMRPREVLDKSLQEVPGQAGPQASVTPMQEVAGEVQAVAGRELPPEGVKILTAQAAHETGDGQHAPGNNFFGIKGRGNNLETTEGEGANARRVRSDFRAYPSATESVQDVVSLLQRKYPDAWRALQMGDAPAYVAALKDGGYFTGSETEYLNGIQRRL